MPTRNRAVRPYKDRPAGSLVEAFTVLVQHAGGNKKAADVCGISRSRIQQLTDPDRKEHIPVGHVIKLERHCRKYAVTHYLALQANMVLVQLPPPNSEKKWLSHISRITKEFSDVLRRCDEFLRDDGDIDPIEAEKLLVEINENLIVLGDMREAVALRARERETTAA